MVSWQGMDVDPRYRYRNATIIDLLQITLDEQRKMRTLIGPEERGRRYQEHQADRNARGGRARGEQQRAAADARVPGLGLLLAQGLSQREIASVLGVSRGVVVRAIERLGGVDRQP